MLPTMQLLFRDCRVCLFSPPIDGVLDLFLLLCAPVVILEPRLLPCRVSVSPALLHSEVCFVSEPGYYEDGAFGIRIENVVLVVPVKTKVSHHVFVFF